MMKPGEKRVGYLFNFKAVTVASETGAPESALYLYFLDKFNKSFSCVYRYHPYFLVDFHEDIGSSGVEVAVAALKIRFPQASGIELVEKEDLDLKDHLSGKRHTFVKMTFSSMDPYTTAKRQLMSLAKDNSKTSQFSRTDPMDFLRGLREHDVPMHVRVCIDNNIRCAKWYNISIVGGSNNNMTSVDDTATMMDIGQPPQSVNPPSGGFAGNAVIELIPSLLTKPDLRVFAWDIETSKAPLKFPDATIDPIMMISAMADGRGYLFVNREEVVRDIEDFEYSPKPDMEGHFKIFNCEDEKSMIQGFYQLIRKLQPQIMVTFNGDNFDFPYVAKRSEILGLDMGREIQIYRVAAGADGDYYSGRWMLHIDCYAWVQRDSYLPQGSQGLKAVTKYKLKYDPVELDPENIAPFARTNPQELASYSVSDALATYYLFKKYIQDFIFALCTVIPTHGDEVLRKGSGTLCELLLMAEAFRANVVFPNKHQEEQIQFHNGRLIETSTYEGGRVECLRTGIYRSDFPEKFHLDLSAIRDLQTDIGNIVEFFFTKEIGVDINEATNVDEVCNEIHQMLEKLANEPNRDEDPLIYHLDVGAMYPNIILSNRLQPSAIADKDDCAACSFNKDAETNKCQRKMAWKWRGELYKATRADVNQIQRELEAPAHRYNTRDLESGEIKRVPWKELNDKDQHECLIRNVRSFSTKAYKRVKSPVTEDRTDTVCQRENSFYIDTVRAFRDRRYEFKDATKNWKSNLEKAEASGDVPGMAQAKDMILLYDSLQLAHKCILNSFYGYVMRKGARWHSMKMAGIVTFTGSNLIREAREFVDRMGLPLELDTDGIWCLLPSSFPDRFKFNLKNGKSVTMTFTCSILNIRVHRKFSNHQYQTMDKETGEWKTSTENSIFFEIDGPYKAMVIPASTEEDRMLKKRYAVFNFDGSIAELKGFEIKRRGELKLVQVFQENVFPAFLQGRNREEVYAAVGKVANNWINVLDTKGAYLTDDELIHLISERKNMTKSVEDSGDLKSVSITTVKRIASFLGESILKEKGICCHLVIANRPIGASATERAIPVQIFSTNESVKRSFLRKWLNDPFMNDFDIRNVIDWEYYKTRLGSTVQKLVIIPALEQRIPNPCPSIQVVEWMRKRVAIQNDKFQQTSLMGFVKKVDVGGTSASNSIVKPPPNSAPSVISVDDVPDKYPEVVPEPPEMIDATAAQAPRIDMEDVSFHTEEDATEDADECIERPKVSLGQVEEWASWQKSRWKQMRQKRLLSNPSSLTKSALSLQQSSLTQDILKASAAGLASMAGGSGTVKNRRLGILPWHVIGIDDDMSTIDQLVIWITIGDAIQRVYLPRYKKAVCLFARSSIASEILGSLNHSFGMCSYRELGTNYTVPSDMLNSIAFGQSCTIGSGQLYEVCVPLSLWNSNLEDSITSSGGLVFESKNSLQFEFSSRLGSVVQIKDLAKVQENFYSNLSILPVDDSDMSAYGLLKECKEKYLPVTLDPIFIHYAETMSPSARVFVCIYSPSTGGLYFSFVGVPPAQRPSVGAIEKLVRETNEEDECDGVTIVSVESSYHDSLVALSRSVNRFVEETMKKMSYHTVCVFSGDCSPSVVKSSSSGASVYIPAMRSAPTCRSPYTQMDSAFPALDWSRWAVKRWVNRAPRLLDWWEDRIWLARISRVAVCDFPPGRDATSYALDVMLSRSLRDEVKHVQWGASDNTDMEAETVSLLSPERSERASCDEISRPGIYRSVCLSLNLRSSLCIAALSRASQSGIEQSLATDKQFLSLIAIVESVYQRGKSAQTRLGKLMESAPQNEVELRHQQRDYDYKSGGWQEKINEAESEVRACGQLLSSIYAWLSNANSTLYSPELLSKTVQAMTITLNTLVDELEKTGCQVIFANFSKILFSTNKTCVEDVTSFWSTLRLNIADHPVLRSLGLDESSVTHEMYGLTWLDQSNYAFIPVDGSGEISWRVEAHWKLGECLPPALRAPFYTYTSEFLMKPMKALYKLGQSASVLTNAQKHAELTLYILNSAIPQIRKKLYTFISDVETKRQGDLVIINAVLDDDEDDEERHSDESDFDDPPQVRRKRRIDELRAKWEYPTLPGVIMPPSTRGLSPAVEFSKFIWEILALERIDARATEDIGSIRNDLLKFFKVSPFSKAAEFDNPIKNSSACKIPNVSCSRCGETSTTVDVVTGPFQGPGLWECTLCAGVYDRDMMESRLVRQIDVIVRGWQTQTLHCEKCKSAKSKLVNKYCDCSGKYKTRIEKSSAVDAIKIIQSVAIAHNLRWLEDRCSFILSRV